MFAAEPCSSRRRGRAGPLQSKAFPIVCFVCSSRCIALWGILGFPARLAERGPGLLEFVERPLIRFRSMTWTTRGLDGGSWESRQNPAEGSRMPFPVVGVLKKRFVREWPGTGLG